MQAIILAAGLGTRLRAITDTLPKALLPVKQKDGGEKPALEGLLDKMIEEGFSCIILNLHHLGGQIRTFVSHYLEKKNLPVKICLSDESKQLLGTGGAIKHACPYLDSKKPLLVHNADILSDLHLRSFMEKHQLGDTATLLVSKRDSPRQLLFTKQRELVGWINKETEQLRLVKSKINLEDCIERAFSGIYILGPQATKLMENQPHVFSIIDFFLEQASTQAIIGVEMPDVQVVDIGKPETMRNTLL